MSFNDWFKKHYQFFPLTEAKRSTLNEKLRKAKYEVTLLENLVREDDDQKQRLWAAQAAWHGSKSV